MGFQNGVSNYNGLTTGGQRVDNGWTTSIEWLARLNGCSMDAVWMQ